FKVWKAIRRPPESGNDAHFYTAGESRTHRCSILHFGSIHRGNPWSLCQQHCAWQVVGSSGGGLCRDFAWAIRLLVGLPCGEYDYFLADVCDTSRVQYTEAQSLYWVVCGVSGDDLHQHRSANFRDEHESRANIRVCVLSNEL